jgi:hypothetical protein
VTANETLRGMGEALAHFPFCPALAFQSTGDPLRPDDFHVEQAETAARLRRGQA